MTCDPYKEQITLLATGELPEIERDQVERHLSACAGCRREFEALRSLCGQIRSLAAEDAQAGVPVGLSERVEKNFVAATRTSHRWLMIAAAACILVGLAFWMVERADKGGVRIGQEPRAVTSVAPTQRVAAKPADLPRINRIVYYRAWLQSPDALDDLLTRDAAVLLRPEPIMIALDVHKFLKTMNLIKEEHNEKHSMRGAVSGAVV
jgi:hypothetical protein